MSLKWTKINEKPKLELELPVVISAHLLYTLTIEFKINFIS